jgi:Ca2+/H+ antiporter
MSTRIGESEASFALSSIEQRRRQVIAEINVPRWYWFALAAGWIALGVIADYAPPWAYIAGTVLFGAAHASIAPRVLSGRRASRELSVRGDLVGRRIPILIIGLLVVMVVLTVAIALLLHADGARHPATWASIVVAALLLVGGPALMGTVRRRAERSLS